MSDHTAGCCEPHPANSARASFSGVAPAARTAAPHRRETAGKTELLVTGSLITMDDTAPRAEAMAVAGGRILAVGSRADLDSFVGPGTRILEHSTGSVLPGFVEPHLHLVSSALVFDGVDCSPYANKTLDAVLSALKAAVAKTPPSADVPIVVMNARVQIWAASQFRWSRTKSASTAAPCPGT